MNTAKEMNEIYQEFGIKSELLSFGREIEEGLSKRFRRIDETAEYMMLDERLFITSRGTKINYKNCEIVCVSGNSMAPEYIHGDRVILDKSAEEFIDGQIFAFRYNGECFMKKIHLLGKRLKAESLNKDYEPFYIEQGEEVKVLGRIIPRVRL